jgi:lipoate-protein ligase B
LINTILIEAGLSDYRKIWDLQKTLFKRVSYSGNQNYLILTEHRPVITIGKSGSSAHLLADSHSLQSKNIDVIEVDRGGDITFHGPGQLVGYPIFNLQNFKMDIHWYLRTLEQIIIDTLLNFKIKSKRIKNLTGVWIGGQKICAIGIKITRWITMHGFALNVTTDLNYFRHIIPCGIKGRGVTSISEILGNNIDINDVTRYLILNFEKYFKIKIVSQDISTLTY